MRMVVVFPAPFGPTKPQTDPLGMARSSPSTTLRFPNSLVSPVVTTARAGAACDAAISADRVEDGPCDRL